jgi:hypothetical protein
VRYKKAREAKYSDDDADGRYLTCISASYHHDLLACGIYKFVFAPLRLQQTFPSHEESLLVLCQKFHCEVNALQVPARHWQVNGLGRAKAKSQGIVV